MERDINKILNVKTIPLASGFYPPRVRFIDEWACKSFIIDERDPYYFVKLGDLIICLINVLKEIR